jgi:hypothetical protein
MVEQHGRQYEADVYNKVSDKAAQENPWLGGDSEAEKVAGDYSRLEGQQLAQGQTFRPGLTPSDYDYRAHTHQELQGFVQTNADSRAVDAQGRIANKLGVALKDFFDKTKEAANKEQSSWQGPAASQAHQYMSGLADWADHAGTGSQLSSNKFSQSSAAVDRAKNSMPAPAGRSTTESMDLVHKQLTGGDLNGAINTLSDIDNQARLQQQAHDQAAQVVSTRDKTYFEANSQHPVFAKPPELNSESTSASGFSGPSEPGGPTGPRSLFGGPGIGSAPVSGAGGAPVTGGASGSIGPGMTTGGGQFAGSGAPGGFHSPGRVSRGPGAGFTGAAIAGGPNGLGSLGSDQYRGTPGRTPTGFRGSAANRLTGGGFGKGGGSGNVSERLAGGKVAASEAEKALGKGSGSGAGKGGLPEERVTRGGAAAAGKGGANGMPGPAAGKGKGDDDKEKKPPGYLQEDDGDELFGGYEGDHKPVPPVIGD